MKYCANCGGQIDDDCKFCINCGTAVNTEGVVVGAKQVHEETAMYNDILVDSSEEVIATLGDGFLRSFIAGNGVRRCESLLTNKRVYLKGMMLEAGDSKLVKKNIEKTIDLEDITGTGFVYSSNGTWKLVLAIIFIITVIPPIFLYISYIKDRENLFFIEYAGGRVMFEISMYGIDVARNYDKQIRRAKDALKK